MGEYLAKIAISAVVVVLSSEIAKRNTLAGAILVSLPLLSLLAMFWLYVDTNDIAKVSELSKSIFWLVLPSLVLFLTLPKFLQLGLGFYLSIGSSSAITVICYFLMVQVLKQYGIRL